MLRAALAALLLLPAVALAAGPRTGFTSCQVRGPRRAATPRAVVVTSPEGPGSAPAPDAQAERDELIQAIQRFDEEGKAYRAELERDITEAYKARRLALTEHFERALEEVETLEKAERDAAIARFEEFLKRYPDDASYTPETMFRLAELYYEQANEEYQVAVEAYAEDSKEALEEGRDPPPAPVKSYARSIALYQRIITGFPRYPFLHGIYYLLAYALGEMNQGDESQAVYADLIRRFPQSSYVPEAWVRMGDWYFDAVQADSLQRAAESYKQVEAYPDHPLYARALYKLGWTYYRMDDFADSVDAFTKLLDHYVAESAKTGERPDVGEVWPEAVQYTAISFTDETWGGVERARSFFQSRGGRSYESDIYTRMGDVYFEETKYALAVQAYKAVIAVDPLSPEAPKVQAKIVLCWSRDRRFDQEAIEREALVATYDQGTPWYEKNKGNPDLVNAVRDLSERSLLRTASFHHAQAQQYKAEGKLEAAVAEYRIASRAYGDHVSRFPHSKQAHELKYQWADCLYNALEFQRAAEVYAEVRDDPSSDAHLADAALSAIISWEGEITRMQRAGQLQERKVLRSADRKPDEVVKAESLPDVLQNLVRDSDAFIDDAPENEHAPDIAYKAGELFYEYGDFAEARCRFDEVVERWPASGVAQYAANLIIESHLTEKNWAAVESASERLQAAAVGKNPTLNASLQKFKLGGRFNKAMQLMEAKQYEPAADAFLKLVAEDPKHEFADKALYNAASCYEGARRFESALRLYERIYDEYPKSVLADEALFRVGFNAENTYDFDKAVSRYILLDQRYPKSKHRKDALFNAARSLENLQRYDEAAGAYVRYAKTYPDADDAARTQFHAALMYEKNSDWKREIQALQEFVHRFSRTKETELVVQAHLKIGLAYRELHQDKEAQAAYSAAVREFSARGLSPDTHASAAAAAAEARFRLAEYDFERYDRITLPATTNTKKLKAALEAKLAVAKKVAPQYDEVMRYKRPDWILAAFYRKAFMLERLAQTLYDAPVPPEVKKNDEYMAAYQDALAQFAQPYEDQAVKVYIDALEAARRLHVKNEWTKKVSESLARYRPSEYPVLKEAKSGLITEDASPAAFADTPDGPTRRELPGPAQPAPATEAAPAGSTSGSTTSPPPSPPAAPAGASAGGAPPVASGGASP